MATASIGGLASGLDTASIISQLLALESLPQTKLKTQVSTEQSKVTALQQLNTRLQTLMTNAGKMAGTTASTAATSVWSSLSATSSNSGVAVTASSTATPATYTVTVGATALSHQLAFTDAHARTDVVTGASSSVLLKRDGQPDVSIATAGGTLEELASAINAADAGVRATLVKTGTSGGTDQFRLLVESTSTGAAQGFQLTDSAGDPLLGGATVRAGRDASITIGGITSTSASNTFTDVTPGVTLTLAASATGSADITVSRDAGARSAAVKSFVDELNGILTQISTLTATGTTAKGVLAGDGAVRRVAGDLQHTLYPTDGSSLAAFGVEIDRFGKFTFDEAAFAEAYAADPAAVAAAFTGATGFAARVEAAAKLASDKYEGTITSAITGRTKTIERLNKNIEAWDDRLALRRTTLERQYTALETTLSQLQGQSAWLSSQLASLSASSE
ncbi:flagellar filament capping protein FliD [Nocardioides sp. SYSU DS0651]|uniref:flagellar filament capping protein FliD n=1 Tax=Nocardioides sp. SYSU DS0651 TaxID=3415955 RepID=UPI003F4B1D70